jgi:hypothetical protein
LLRKKPKFVKNREAATQIKMVTESIPQLVLQIYIFQKKNHIFKVFSSPSIFYESPQIISIITSTLTIIFGLIFIYGHEAFYYYEQKRILLDKIRYAEKELLQKIGRFFSLMIWYFSVVISRIILIALILSYKPYLIISLISLMYIKSMILNKFEKKYFEQKKFLKEYEKETKALRHLFSEEYGEDNIEKLTYFKQKSLLKSILTFFILIFGVYENMFINIDYHSTSFYIPRQTKNYIIFYLLFYIENIIFAISLYFVFNDNLRIIFFYVLTFPISVLIQILYQKIKIGEKVSLYFSFVY